MNPRTNRPELKPSSAQNGNYASLHFVPNVPEENAALAARLARIQSKLDQLRAADPALTLFGSDTHEYHLQPALPPEAVSEWEKHLGVQLPDEYRLFVTLIGDGGAGPYYGLISLDGPDPEDLTQPELTRKPFRWTEAFNPYDWEDPCSQEDVWCDDEEDWPDEMLEADPDGRGEEAAQPPRQIILGVPGALYICHCGCGIRFILVVNGQCRGEVWRDAQNDDAGLRPECDDRGRHLGFLDWYEQWLDGDLAKLGIQWQDLPVGLRNDDQGSS
ncbi:SMI1/KNR4 family protein [Paludibaculum fermentans]|uniref:SMI1/KNR4 family protein n=1 Tax=Paludibaculum fermentans TaxID=1473598 RepID=UPI003EB95F9B